MVTIDSSSDVHVVVQDNPQLCCRCNDIIVDKIGSYFALDCSSKHIVCVECFSNLAQQLGSSCQIDCPGPDCNEKVDKWNAHYAKYEDDSSSSSKIDIVSLMMMMLQHN